MEVIILRKLLLYICLIVVHAKMNIATESDSNATSFKDINGQTLLKMGRQLEKPVLTLIGMAITNLHSCGHWNKWSECTGVRVGYIGIRKRTRECGQNLSKLKTETDFTICEGYCPNDYTVTANGYCMKLYTTKKTQEEAGKQCNDDEGHLINVDSDLKYSDYKTVRTGYSGDVFIDGRRKEINSPWIGSGGSPVEFIKWGSGDPDNGSNDLCLLLSTGNDWYDTTCTTARAFICEISV